MIIRTAKRLISPPEKGKEVVVILIPDNWNDWYSWKTLFYAYLYTSDGNKVELGGVKIAELDAEGSEGNPYRPSIPEEGVPRLTEPFVSVGQSENYYATLKQIPDDDRVEYLNGMRDAAFLALDDKFLSDSSVFSASLMRDIGWQNLTGRYRRLSRGNADPTDYKFSYFLPYGDENQHDLELKFSVEAESKPPSNVHVIIGRNSVGKTRCLNSMAKALTSPAPERRKFGHFTFAGDEEDASEVDFSFSEKRPNEQFSGVVLVSFSAFDRYGPNPHAKDDLFYHYVGLKKTPESTDSDLAFEDDLILEQKSFSELADEFADSARKCRIGWRRQAWRESLESLETDPLFEELEIRNLANKAGTSAKKDKHFFRRLSSGHGIVLLSVTRLVQLVEEQTLVLFDEPETHLHPPIAINASSHSFGVALQAERCRDYGDPFSSCASRSVKGLQLSALPPRP